jgi:membrane protein DedA with SNARE-associated domain
LREEDQVTIWLSMVSLMVGVLLAQRFKIIVLAPATFVIVIVAAAIGIQLGTGLRPMVFTVTIASLGIQIGYFFGMFFQHGLAALRGLRTSRSSEQRTTQRPSIYRTPIL